MDPDSQGSEGNGRLFHCSLEVPLVRWALGRTTAEWGGWGGVCPLRPGVSRAPCEQSVCVCVCVCACVRTRNRQTGRQTELSTEEGVRVSDLKQAPRKNLSAGEQRVLLETNEAGKWC